MHEVRLCKYGELKLLQKFLHEHWSKNHIFTYSDNLLNWQHGDFRKKIINFVVAFNRESKEFDAILGFIPTSQYDSNIGTNDIWLAIWKVKAKYAKTGIGLQVYLFLNSKYKPSSIGAFGISNDTLKICKAFNYRTGVLKHFYIKNDNLTNYSIAKFTNQSTNNTHNVSNVYIRPITDKEFMHSNLTYQYSPNKTKDYFINKYFNNEFYQYTFYGLEKSGVIIGAFISRKILVNKAKCIRIVDWIGGYSNGLYDEFQVLLKRLGAEYIDLLCKVPNENEIISMGFIQKDTVNDTIPHYFEPFLKKNVSIEFAYKTKERNYAFFKADGDQDRPS